MTPGVGPGGGAGWPWGGSRMAREIRAHDWSGTALAGPLAHWPAALRHALDACLGGGFASFVWWGPELLHFHNDASLPILRDKAPQALGVPARTLWRDMWHEAGPLVDEVLRTGEPVAREAFPTVLVRDGQSRPAWFTFSYNPLRDDAGAVCGIHIVMLETTRSVESQQRDLQRHDEMERRTFLLELEERLRPMTDAEAILHEAARSVGQRLGASRVGYAEDGGDGATVLVLRNYVDGVRDLQGRYRYEDYGPALVAALRQGRPVVQPDTASDASLSAAQREAFAALSIGAAVNVPLIKQGGLAAILFMHHRLAHEWSAADLALLQAVGDATWEALERARAERALAVGAAEYRSLVDAIDEGFVVVEIVRDAAGQPVDGWQVRSNPAYLRLAGRDDLVGRRLGDVPGVLAPAWIGRLAEVARTGVPGRWDEPVRARGRWFDVKAFRVGAAGGGRVAVLLTDITERRRAERSLRDIAERQRFLLRLGDALAPLSDPVAILTLACVQLGRHLAVHRAAHAEIEAGGGSVVRAQFQDETVPAIRQFPYRLLAQGVLETCHREGGTLGVDDVLADPRLSPAEREACQAAGVRAFLCRLLVKDGRWVAAFGVQHREPRTWSDADGALVDEVAERTWSAVERARAQAATREGEARLSLFANLVPDLLWSNDPRGHIEWLNERLAGLFAAAGSSSGGLSWERLLHPEDLPRVQASWSDAMASGQPYASERRLRAADGQYRWHLLRAEPMRDADGRVLRWVGAATDVHEQRAARELLEERVQARTRELELATERRRRLLTRIERLEDDERRRIARELHDALGQQLTAVMLAVSQVSHLCGEAEPGEDPADRSRRRDEALGRVERLLKDVDADLDRIVFELRPTGLEDVGLAEGLAAYVDTWSQLSGVKVDLLSRGFDRARLPMPLEAAIFRVAQEALNNVSKHARAAEVNIALECGRDELRMTIEDDGVGFAVAADGTFPATRPSWGLLGMKERVESLGGTFALESSEGRGTTVIVRVPVAGRASPSSSAGK